MDSQVGHLVGPQVRPSHGSAAQACGQNMTHVAFRTATDKQSVVFPHSPDTAPLVVDVCLDFRNGLLARFLFRLLAKCRLMAVHFSLLSSHYSSTQCFTLFFVVTFCPDPGTPTVYTVTYLPRF